jgi:four helix bundle protein
MAEAKKKRDFENLRIFQLARGLVNRICDLTQTGRFAKDFSLRDQMRRAAVSILSNIAEGFECGSDPGFIRSLRIAKGSCGELRAQLLIARDRQYLTAAEQEEARSECRKISSGLHNLIRYLRENSRSQRSSP